MRQCRGRSLESCQSARPNIDIYKRLTSAWDAWNRAMLPEIAQSFTYNNDGATWADHINTPLIDPRAYDNGDPWPSGLPADGPRSVPPPSISRRPKNQSFRPFLEQESVADAYPAACRLPHPDRFAHAFAHANERVLFSRAWVPTQAVLFVAQADGSGERVLLPASSLDYDPAWSPKGDWIAFTSERNGSADLYRVHPDGTGLARLTDNPAYDDQAGFSPDEKQVVFVRRTRRRLCQSVAARYRHRQVARPDHRTGRRLPSRLVAGRQMDHLFLRPRQRLPSAKGRWRRRCISRASFLVHPDGSGRSG